MDDVQYHPSVIRNPHTGRLTPLHAEKHPMLDQDCWGCKAVGITFGAVPGGARPAAKTKTHNMKVESNLNRYKRKREAGERPPGTTREAMDKHDRKVDTWLRHENDLRDNHTPERVAEVKKALTGDGE